MTGVALESFKMRWDRVFNNRRTQGVSGVTVTTVFGGVGFAAAGMALPAAHPPLSVNIREHLEHVFTMNDFAALVARILLSRGVAKICGCG